MAALDDYKTTVPTWLLVLRALDERGTPTMLTDLSRELLKRSDARVGWSLGLVRKIVLRMVDDGLVDVVEVVKEKKTKVEYPGGRRRLSGYTLTEDGRGFVVDALQATRTALGL